MTSRRLPVGAVIRRGAALWTLWVIALFALAALLALTGAGSAVRHGIGDPGLRSTAQGAGTILRILARNLPVAAIPLTAAHTVPRHPQWRPAADIYTTTTATLSLVGGATALAAFRGDLMRYAIAFGPIEIAGFALAIAVYHNARDQPPRPWHDLAPAATLATATLTIAAILEARLGGVL